MSIRDEVMALLSPAPAIDFRLASTNGVVVRVDAVLFRAVHAAVAGRTTGAGRVFGIQVIVNPGAARNTEARNTLTGERIGSGGDAFYESRGNVFTFTTPSIGTNLHLKALVIHEAVHAGLDLGRTAPWAIDDEAAAYLAQCMYLRANGVTSVTPRADLPGRHGRGRGGGAGCEPARIAAGAAAGRDRRASALPGRRRPWRHLCPGRLSAGPPRSQARAAMGAAIPAVLDFRSATAVAPASLPKTAPLISPEPPG